MLGSLFCSTPRAVTSTFNSRCRHSDVAATNKPLQCSSNNSDDASAITSTSVFGNSGSPNAGASSASADGTHERPTSVKEIRFLQKQAFIMFIVKCCFLLVTTWTLYTQAKPTNSYNEYNGQDSNPHDGIQVNSVIFSSRSSGQDTHEEKKINGKPKKPKKYQLQGGKHYPHGEKCVVGICVNGTCTNFRDEECSDY
uniref:Evasin n=1 Tax=Rhipicephalus zambeziensis TaxID=60191 RepID=A0A224YIA2_9ACAR